MVGKVQLEEGPTEILDGDTHGKGVGPRIVRVCLVKDLEGLHPRGHRDALVKQGGREEQAIAGGKLAQLELLDI